MLSQQTLAALTPAEDLTGVLSRLEQLGEALTPDDGLLALTSLYLEVAQAVAGALLGGDFAEAEFLRRLAVNFANLYFETLRRGLFPTEKARLGLAWAPLFAARSLNGLSPSRFARAGMHAHLNHELCLAIVRTCEQRALTPEKGTPQQRDFQRLGELWHQHLSHVGPGTADDTAAWSCREAWSLAWDNAEVLWHLRSSAELTADYLSLLERNVVAASRTLLAPTPPISP